MLVAKCASTRLPAAVETSTEIGDRNRRSCAAFGPLHSNGRYLLARRVAQLASECGEHHAYIPCTLIPFGSKGAARLAVAGNFLPQISISKAPPSEHDLINPLV